MAAVLAAGDGAVASHASAARLWEFVHRPEDAVEVTGREPSSAVERRGRAPHDDPSRRRRDRAVRHPVHELRADAVRLHDAALAVPTGRVLDDGLRRGVASLDRLQRCAARLDSGPGRRLGVDQGAARAARRVVRSGWERVGARRAARSSATPGCREPVQQYPVRVDGRPYVLDFAWPEQRVFAEYYGLAVHSGASAVAYDSDRLTALVGRGLASAGVHGLDAPTARSSSDVTNALLERTPSDWCS